jgi:hypothetical protein
MIENDEENHLRRTAVRFEDVLAAPKVFTKFGRPNLAKHKMTRGTRCWFENGVPREPAQKPTHTQKQWCQISLLSLPKKSLSPSH